MYTGEHHYPNKKESQKTIQVKNKKHLYLILTIT